MLRPRKKYPSARLITESKEREQPPPSLPPASACAEGAGCLSELCRGFGPARHKPAVARLKQGARSAATAVRQAGKCRVGLGSKVPVCCRICSVPSALGSGFLGLLLRPTVFGFRTLVGAGASSWGLRGWVLVILSLRGSSAAPAQEHVLASLKPGWRCKAETQGIKHGKARVDFSCKVTIRHYFWGLLMPS